jgi:hypothetical protein
MSHHYSGPNIGFPRGDARLDLTDLYAFPKPGDPGKSILIIDFHPSVGLNPPGPTTSEPFAPEARYELKIDTDGDAVANKAANRPRRCAALRALRPPQALAGRLSLRECRSRQGARRMGRRLGTTGSSPVGVAILSSSTYWGRSTNFSSRVGISSQTKILAVSCWKCPTLCLGRQRLGCGLVR